jgi:hypothetical protein
MVLFVACTRTETNDSPGSQVTPTTPIASGAATSPSAISSADRLRQALLVDENFDYSSVTVRSDSFLDAGGQTLCREARKRYPLDRHDADILALALARALNLSHRRGVVAEAKFLVIYCPEVTQ